MFCFQCQETARNKGCTVKGVCGKPADVAELQDLLVSMLKVISNLNLKLAEKNVNVDVCVDRFITESLFMTITNANFDKERFFNRINKAIKIRDYHVEQCKKNGIEIEDISVANLFTWTPSSNDDIVEKSTKVGILNTENEDIRSLRELLTYGLKGMSAYTEHAEKLGFEEKEIYTFIKEALNSTMLDLSVDELVALVLKCGEFGVKAMALLDKANTTTYGNPEITKVDIGVRNNPGILISGHDLKDLEELLEQTKGTGVDVYTHSEMLPAHYYPKFKKYPHFAGNYGNAWWKQTDEFQTFNGVFLFTTNCIVPPRANANYADRVYTTGAAGFPGFKHIPDREEGKQKDFSELIEHAKKCPPPTQIEEGEIVGGFAHNQVFELADQVVEAVKSGAIRKFVVMAGCDGRMKSRNYYTEFAEKLPKDVVILTAGCAKYKYNKLNLGDINGIPRVLDAGQCNDSYSLAVIALKLQEIFGLDSVNDLPLVYNIAWYEQKAVIVLLALLSLGVKNIHLGPTLPAFLSPNVTKVLVDNFGIGTISTVDEDIESMIN